MEPLDVHDVGTQITLNMYYTDTQCCYIYAILLYE